MQTVIAKIEHELPWLNVGIGEFGNKKFRKQNSLPTTSINCIATKHRYLSLFPEADGVWTIVLFVGNGSGSAFFSKRITRPRATFAVYSFFLEELLEALEQSLGMGPDIEEPSGQQRDSEIQKQVMLVRQAIKIEASVVHKDDPYDLSHL
jgi:hypothetical protein